VTIPICVDDCGEFTITDGVLGIGKAVPDECNPGEILCDSGLRYYHRVPTLSRKMVNAEKNTVATNITWDQELFTGPGNYDDGSASGLWTVEANGSITLNCTGVYGISLWAGIADAVGGSGPMYGIISRVLDGANVVSTSTIKDFSGAGGGSTIDLATAGDGSEATCSTPGKRLVAGTNLTWFFQIAATGGGNYFASGEFNLSFQGHDNS
jgi:hypothetical protein